MGMSDVTCGVTNIPIRCGDPCRFFFLRQTIAYPEQLEPGDYEHIWAQWTPMSLPIKGVYDGYGRVIQRMGTMGGKDLPLSSSDRVLQFQVETLQRVLPKTLPEDAKHYPFAKHYPNTMGSLLGACERGFLTANLPSKWDADTPTQLRRISPFYIRENTYQLLTRKLKEGGIDYWRTRTEDTNPDYVQSLRNAIERSQRDFSRLRELGLGDIADHFENDEWINRVPRDLTAGLMDNMPDPFVVGRNHKFDVTRFKTLLEFTDADWEELNYRLLENLVLFFTMGRLYRPFQPNMCHGQFSFYDQDLDGHRMLARHIDEEIVAMEEKYKQEEE